MFKMIALDIDGTLKVSGEAISEYTKSVLTRCKDRGAMLVVATGRSRKSADFVASELGILDYVVSFQGALITLPKSEEPIWSRSLDRARLLDVLQVLSQWEVEKVAYVKDFICVEKMTKWTEDYAKRNGVEIRLVSDLCSLDEDPYRLLAVGEEYEIETIERITNFKFQRYMYITRSLPNYCEFLNPEAGKEKALDWICKKHGVKPQEVLAFGNGFNDVGLLAWSGLGVAIEDSEESILNIADDIALSAEDDGVARYINKLLEKRESR